MEGKGKASPKPVPLQPHLPCLLGPECGGPFCAPSVEDLVQPSWQMGLRGSSCVICWSPKCRQTKDPTFLLNSAQNQSHANGYENYFHCHLSKMEPCHPLPSSQPRLPGPTLMSVLVIASSLFIHIQTSEAGIQMGPPTSERPGGK